MNRIQSGWRITYDPSGSSLVVMTYGDLIEAEVHPTLTKPVEVVDIPWSDAPFLRAMGNRRFELKFGVFKDYSTSALARRNVLDSLMNVGARSRKPLKVEVDGYASTYWTFADAWINAHDPEPIVERGKNRAVFRYTITATGLTRTGT